MALAIFLLSSAMLTRLGWLYVKVGPMSIMLAESQFRVSVFNPRVALPLLEGDESDLEGLGYANRFLRVPHPCVLRWALRRVKNWT